MRGARSISMATDPEPVDRARLAELRRLDEAQPEGGVHDFFARLVGSYLELASPRLAGMRAAASEGDAGRLHQLAHQLKGASSNLGADVAAGLCETLEVLAQQGTLDQPAVLAEAETTLSTLAGELDRVVRSLEAELARKRSTDV